MRKLCIANLVMSIIASTAFFSIIKIDNESRLPENIYTDYHMNSLPFIYLLTLALIVLIAVNLSILFSKKSRLTR